MHGWHVWDVVPVTESWSVMGKFPIQGKWIEVNKGDLETPVVRSQNVAKEVTNTESDDTVSPTPLEALRLLLSHAAGGHKILVVDARKAYFHAYPRDGKLFSLKAAGEHGIRERPAHAASKDLSCVVHGDDTAFAGVESDLDWARQQMKKSFLVMVTGRLGGDKQDVRDLRVLNRVA